MRASTSEKALLRRSQASDLLGVSPRRIGQLVAAGELEYVGIGRQRLIVYDSVVEFVEPTAVVDEPVATHKQKKNKPIFEQF